jgi:hypothetical protein
VLAAVPTGPHRLRFRGICFLEQYLDVVVRGDTLRLPPIVLRVNPKCDSLNFSIN